MRQTLQAGTVELVVVHQRGEPATVMIRDMPDERPLVEQLVMLFEEPVLQPPPQRLPPSIRITQQAIDQPTRITLGTKRLHQQLTEPVRCRCLTPHRWETHDPILIRQPVQLIGFLIRPRIAQQPGHRYLQRIRRLLRPTQEQPLRRIIRPRLRQPIRKLTARHPTPILNIKRNLGKVRIRRPCMT